MRLKITERFDNWKNIRRIAATFQYKVKRKIDERQILVMLDRANPKPNTQSLSFFWSGRRRQRCRPFPLVVDHGGTLSNR